MIEIIHKSSVASPKVSIIFIDWSCRESLHSLDYLADQTVSRDEYEIIFVEYYSRRTGEVSRRLENARAGGRPDPVDQWIIMGMPDDLYYHKHLMYNVGIAASRGEIVMIGDSDAMFRPTFIQSMLETFDLNGDVVLHYDEVRNTNRKYYPFNYPSFEEVIGEGVRNWRDGTTTGLLDLDDPIHLLNFGAAFCARRKDLIKIGGADEHTDYVGYVCGPYELTFRLENFGRVMIWHGSEFLYHTWHPGVNGGGNLVGPHDGKHVSTRALLAKEIGRVFPWRENRAIQRLRQTEDLSFESLVADLVDPDYLMELKLERLQENPHYTYWLTATYVDSIGDYILVSISDFYAAVPKPLWPNDFSAREIHDNHYVIKGVDEESVRRKLDAISATFNISSLVDSIGDYDLFAVSDFYVAVPKALGHIDFKDRECLKDPHFVRGENERSVRQQLEENAATFVTRPKLTTVINDSRHGLSYNLTAFGGGYYGLPQKFGALDFFSDRHILSHWAIIFARNRVDAERQIHEFLASDKAADLAALDPASLDWAGQMHDKADADALPAEIVEAIGGWNIVRFQGRFYGVPQELEPGDLAGNADLRNDSRIIKSESLDSLQATLKSWSHSKPVEFVGWLPVFRRFGDCGRHPQFIHTTQPPQGYYFRESGPNRSLNPGRTLFMLVKLVTRATGLAARAMIAGARPSQILRFLATRGLREQLALPMRPQLVFVPSVPYTLGQDNWLIEIEDTISLMFPFVHNGQTRDIGPEGNPILPILKVMLESNSCKGIITHMKSTADSIPTLFRSERLREKVTYAPMGVSPKPVYSRSRFPKTRIDLLFTNSWRQKGATFFNRGGLDVLEAFAILRKKYSHVYLTLRTTLPDLGERHRQIVYGEGVRLLDKFLARESWHRLIRQCDIYMLPSDRIHVMSMLEAMSFGTVLLTSDGWGIDEYVRHGETGIIVPGRYGKVTWMEKASGILREHYAHMHRPDKEVIDRIVEEVSALVEDPDKMYRIQTAARRSVAEEFTIDRWNNGLKTALDKAVACP